MDDVYKAIGLKIKSFRKVSGISQAEIAHRCNVSCVTMSHLENGKHQPSVKLIFKISKELNVHFYEFFNIETNKPSVKSRIEKENKIIASLKMTSDERLSDFEAIVKALLKDNK